MTSIGEKDNVVLSMVNR